jgi:acetyl-CoA carboxylase carboxyl transferase subunit alpha
MVFLEFEKELESLYQQLDKIKEIEAEGDIDVSDKVKELERKSMWQLRRFIQI